MWILAVILGGQLTLLRFEFGPACVDVGNRIRQMAPRALFQCIQDRGDGYVQGQKEFAIMNKAQVQNYLQKKFGMKPLKQKGYYD